MYQSERPTYPICPKRQPLTKPFPIHTVLGLSTYTYVYICLSVHMCIRSVPSPVFSTYNSNAHYASLHIHNIDTRPIRATLLFQTFPPGVGLPTSIFQTHRTACLCNCLRHSLGIPKSHVHVALDVPETRSVVVDALLPSRWHHDAFE